MIAKTGTTAVASALSGFVRDRYVFAVLQNGRPIPTRSARAAQDRFATVLAGIVLREEPRAARQMHQLQLAGQLPKHCGVERTKELVRFDKLRQRTRQ